MSLKTTIELQSFKVFPNYSILLELKNKGLTYCSLLLTLQALGISQNLKGYKVGLPNIKQELKKEKQAYKKIGQGLYLIQYKMLLLTFCLVFI